MSKILGVTKITITINELTGAVSCVPDRDITNIQLLAVFNQLSMKYLEGIAASQGMGPRVPAVAPPDNPSVNPVGNPGGNSDATQTG